MSSLQEQENNNNSSFPISSPDAGFYPNAANNGTQLQVPALDLTQIHTKKMYIDQWKKAQQHLEKPVADEKKVLNEK